MRWLIPIVVVLGFLRVGATADEELPMKALEALQGTWTVESQRSDLGARPKSGLECERLVVEKNKWIRKGGHKEGGAARIELDPTATPLAIDVIYFDGVTGKELRYLGIYRLEGDTLTVVTNLGGTERPKRFEVGKDVYLSVYKREMKPLARDDR